MVEKYDTHQCEERDIGRSAAAASVFFVSHCQSPMFAACSKKVVIIGLNEVEVVELTELVLIDSVV